LDYTYDVTKEQSEALAQEPETTSHALTVVEAILEPERSRYINGLCFELADELHRIYGYQFGAVWRDEPDDLDDGLFPEEESLMSSIVHVFVMDDHGNALDACGQRSLSSFTEDWEAQPSANGAYRIEAPISRFDITAELGEPESGVDFSEILSLIQGPSPTLDL
jgi:hypothetical protein